MAGWESIGMALGRALSGADRDEAQSKMGMELSKQAALMSTAQANKAKADELAQRMQYRTPEYASKLAGTLAGLTDPQSSLADTYSRTGSWGNDVKPLPADQAGPPLVTPAKAPEWATPDTLGRYNRARATTMLNLAGTGDSNAGQMADAFGKLLEQGRLDQALAGGVRGLNAYKAAQSGKLYDAAPQGVLSQETGIETPNPEWVRVQQSIAGENAAQARSADASAALSHERINTERADAELKRSKIGQGQTVTLPDGTVIATGASMPKLTEVQSKAQLYGSRAAEADRILNELEGKYSPVAVNAKDGAEGIWGIGGALGAVGNLMLSREGQMAEQAQRDFINAVLRQESGAVISPAEFDNARKQYFPQPGDSQAVLAQKRRNRQTAIDGLRVMAGPAADRVRPREPEQPAPQQAQAQRPPTPAEKTAILAEARAALAAGAPREKVIQRLRELGVKDGSL